MAGLPEITMAGTLTADPEMRFTPSGAGVCSFTLVANDRRLDKESGEWRDMGATFLRCTVWRRQAENVADAREDPVLSEAPALRARRHAVAPSETAGPARRGPKGRGCRPRRSR